MKIVKNKLVLTKRETNRLTEICKDLPFDAADIVEMIDMIYEKPVLVRCEQADTCKAEMCFHLEPHLETDHCKCFCQLVGDAPKCAPCKASK